MHLLAESGGRWSDATHHAFRESNHAFPLTSMIIRLKQNEQLQNTFHRHHKDVFEQGVSALRPPTISCPHEVGLPTCNIKHVMSIADSCGSDHESMCMFTFSHVDGSDRHQPIPVAY